MSSKPGRSWRESTRGRREQTVAASDALVLSARATLDMATKEFDRQKLLFEKKYTSQAALERAEAQFKATQAQVSAQLAQAGAARAQSGFFVVRAPYGGVVADVPAVLGDMAMPGRPLLTIYDPASLRVTASIPQTEIARIASGKPARVQFPRPPPMNTECRDVPKTLGVSGRLAAYFQTAQITPLLGHGKSSRDAVLSESSLDLGQGRAPSTLRP
jgi:multidrug efflux pump subunit AcrA (membrane-fusion protein)